MIGSRFDSVIRFFIYVAVFWLPYSPAVVETCIAFAILSWFLKRTSAACGLMRQGSFSTEKSKWIKLLKAYQLPATSLNVPIVVFLFACLASISGSAFFNIALRGFFTKTLEWFAVYFLVVESFKTRRHLMVFLLIWAVTAGATAIDALQQFFISHKDVFFGRELQPGGRVTAAFKTPNGLGGYLTIAVPVAAALTLDSSRRRYALIAALIFFLLIGTLALTGSRGAWIGVSCGLALLAIGLLRVKNEKAFQSSQRKWFLIGGVSVMLALIFLNAPSILRTETIGWRVETWRVTLEMIKDKWLFGHGLNTFMRVFDVYRGEITNPTYAHNCYLQLAAETGLFGLVAFLAMMGCFLMTMFAAMRQKAQNERFVLLALTSGVAAFLVHSFVDNNWYSLQLSVYLWLSIGLREAIIYNQHDEVKLCQDVSVR